MVNVFVCMIFESTRLKAGINEVPIIMLLSKLVTTMFELAVNVFDVKLPLESPINNAPLALDEMVDIFLLASSFNNLEAVSPLMLTALKTGLLTQDIVVVDPTDTQDILVPDAK